MTAQQTRILAERLLAQGQLAPAAEAFLQLGLTDKALGLVRQLLAEDATPALELLLLLGRIHAEREEHEAAAEAFRRACRRGEASGEADFRLGCALAALGDFDAALYHLGESLHLDPTRLEIYDVVVRLLWGLDKPRAALEFLRRSVLALPVSELHSLLARAAVVAGEPEVAKQAITWLRDHGPDSAARSLELGGLLLALGELEAAALEYQEAAKLEPGSPEPQHGLATLSLERHERAAAEACFKAALARDASHWPSLNDYGLLLLVQGRVGEAVAMLRRAVLRQPDEAASHLNLALALLSSGARAGAQHHARAAQTLARDPDVKTQAIELVRQLG